MGMVKSKFLMMKTALGFVLCFIICFSTEISARQRPPPPSTTSSSATTTTTSSSSSDDSTSSDDVEDLVKGYIDAGTCDTVSTGSSCGDSAESYYSEFEYNGRRIVIANGIPNHDAENDQFTVNPNTRCERWTYMSLPLNPTLASSAVATDMGVIGYATTGGSFYNDLSSPSGDVALYNEGITLDSCNGHSSSNSQYHYHANILCVDDAADADVCSMIGYARDGVPIFGYCNDADGTQFTSGYSESEVIMSSGTYYSASMATYYEYDSNAYSAGSCNLDEANGAIHPATGEYSYFMTTTYPWVPLYYYGSEGVSDLCSAA